ncbi:Di-copper centre-containing protein, partial [Neoconidiobolus thromboides FSU 785]
MFTITNIFVFITLLIAKINGQGCSTITRRPEIRELNGDQLSRFINAFIKLNGTQNNYYSISSGIHYNNSPVAHGVPAFFPWHREFLRRFELALQKVDPTVILPYWDWTKDSQSPEKSIVFQPDHFGGNGGSGGCIRDASKFNNFQTFIPNGHCLQRQFNGGNVINSFYSPEAVEAIFIQSRDYNSFHNGIENGPHGAVHVGIGGNSGDMSYMYSSNDPLFYLHHCFIDLLWNEWQQRN